ncbi:MAG: thioredoxin family protein [Ignavibacteriaceae bacterium]
MEYKLIEERINQVGVKYQDYLDKLIDDILKTDPDSLDEKGRSKFETKRLNLQRSARIMKTYKVSGNLKEEIKRINEPQTWMVITENWCGDSAQNLPYLALIAEENPNINFKILLRDSNPDIMDQFLTNGTRSIPILVAFDSNGNELFRWGARPKVVQDLFNQWKAEGIVKPELYKKLHLWYAKNKGQAIESEFLDILKTVEQVSN